MALTRQEEYVARWLRRAGGCSLRQAREYGIDERALDALVDAGLVGRTGSGPETVYRIRDDGAKLPPGPEAKPQAPIQSLPVPIDRQIVDLLADGHPLSAGEIASVLLPEGSGFTAQTVIARNVQKALPGLISRGHLHRIMFGAPSSAAGRSTYRYEEKFVAAASVAPVCLGCFRNHWSMDAVPPQASGHPIALCVICGRRTNGGAYVPIAEAEERRIDERRDARLTDG